MKTYNREQLHSFKYQVRINPEIAMKRVCFKKGKKLIMSFYAECTDNCDIIYVPASILTDVKDNSPYGFTAAVKDGDYFMGKCKVELSDAHSVYNGAGYVMIKRLTY